MSELTRYDAEQLAEQRALRAEHENADLALRLQQSQSELHAKQRAYEEADRRAESNRRKLQTKEEQVHLAGKRANKAEAERDQARQEAARLREALTGLRYYINNPSAWATFDQCVSDEIERAAGAALQSAPPASEPEYEHLGDYSAVEPWHRVLMSCDRCKVTWDGCWDNYQCPRCGEGELPWQPDPAPADRPEPSEALPPMDMDTITALRDMGMDEGEVLLVTGDGWGDIYWHENARKLAALFRQSLSQPAPASEPSEADDPDDPAESAYWRFDARVKGYGPWRGAPMSERDAFKVEYRQAIAQPAPAVPEWLRPTGNDQTLGWSWSVRGLQHIANLVTDAAGGEPEPSLEAVDAILTILHQERALAAQFSDSPAVPDGYVLVPEEPTDSMKIAGIDVAPMHREYYPGTFSSKGKRASLDTDQCDEIYRAMLAAAPTPTDDGES